MQTLKVDNMSYNGANTINNFDAVNFILNVIFMILLERNCKNKRGTPGYRPLGYLSQGIDP